jgi:hypothetical protein
MEEYHKEMRILGGKLLDVFFSALGLTADQIAVGETERKIRETLTATMHLNLYVQLARTIFLFWNATRPASDKSAPFSCV